MELLILHVGCDTSCGAGHCQAVQPELNKRYLRLSSRWILAITSHRKVLCFGWTENPFFLFLETFLFPEKEKGVAPSCALSLPHDKDNDIVI